MTPSTSVVVSDWVTVGSSSTGGASVGVGVDSTTPPLGDARVGVVAHSSKDDHGVRARPMKALRTQKGHQRP